MVRNGSEDEQPCVQAANKEMLTVVLKAVAKLLHVKEKIDHILSYG